MKLPLSLLLSGFVVTGAPLSSLLAQTPAATHAVESSGVSAEWPREITAQGVHLVIYEPKVDAWEGSKLLKARAAFVMTPGKGKSVIGIVELEGPTSTNLESRTVEVRNLKVTEVRFPSVVAAEVPPTEELFRRVFPAKPFTVSLDRLVDATGDRARPLNLKMDPPRIIVSERPALLLLVEGKPVLAPAGAGQFVVNANWDVFFDPAAKRYYLLGGLLWYTAETLDGEWTLASRLPAFLSSLPAGDQWAHIAKTIPPKVERGQPVAEIEFSNVPTELIAFDGPPVWEEVEGTGLVWARNTDSRVFRLGGEFYFLASGRWFRAEQWNGPWTYAGNDLPDDFRRIPDDAPCADVLASVPGTTQAADAILLASIPREAVVNVSEAESKAEADYSGEPEFRPIEGTKMAYAANTSSDVIQVENNYYLCQSGVWFVSTTPRGRWRICREVPEVIYTIPVSSPVHRVVYVTVEPGYSSDVVVCSYTSGYEGAYIAGVATGAALVWGTGYYYSPYVAWGAVPVYYPWPCTYGTAAVYNPWSGGYAVGNRYYGPYGSAGSAAWYNPHTGRYGRAARVSTPYGRSTYAAGYNPRTDTGWATRQNYNGYTQWGSTAVRRGDDWLRVGHAANENGAVVGWRGSEGSGHVWKTDNHSGGTARYNDNFYAGRDGNVYRRDENGDWAKYDDGDWESVESPERSKQSSKQSNQVSSSGQSSGKESGKGRNREDQSGAEGSRRGRGGDDGQRPEGSRRGQGAEGDQQPDGSRRGRGGNEGQAPEGSRRGQGGEGDQQPDGSRRRRGGNEGQAPEGSRRGQGAEGDQQSEGSRRGRGGNGGQAPEGFRREQGAEGDQQPDGSRRGRGGNEGRDSRQRPQDQERQQQDQQREAQERQRQQQDQQQAQERQRQQQDQQQAQERQRQQQDQQQAQERQRQQQDQQQAQERQRQQQDQQQAQERQRQQQDQQQAQERQRQQQDQQRQAQERQRQQQDQQRQAQERQRQQQDQQRQAQERQRQQQDQQRQAQERQRQQQDQQRQAQERQRQQRDQQRESQERQRQMQERQQQVQERQQRVREPRQERERNFGGEGRERTFEGRGEGRGRR